MGAGDYSMRIWLDPAALRIRNISAADVYQAIQSQNVEVSAGAVGQPLPGNPTPGNTNIGNVSSGSNAPAYQYSLTVKGRLSSPEEFGNIILRTEAGGRVLRLRDVAHIDLGSASYSVVSRLNGQPTAAIAIYQQPGSNSLDVSKGVKEKMQELSESFPSGIHYSVTLDTTDVIHASVDEVLVTFLETTLLAFIVTNLCKLPFPTELAGGYHSMYHHSRITHRYSGGDGALRILHQYTDAVRTDTCRGHCGG